MGIDFFVMVIGVNPKSEKGSYFRNNVWWWRPLALYICNEHDEIASACEYWHPNDGDGLDEDDARALGLALLDDISNGKTAEFERNAEYPFSVDNVRNFAEFLLDCGGLQIC